MELAKISHNDPKNQHHQHCATCTNQKKNLSLLSQASATEGKCHKFMT